MREVVAAALLFPAEIVEPLVADDNDSVRMAAAANPNLPGHVMWRAAFGADTAVADAVASNPAAAAELLEAIVSKRPDVALSVASNSACSPETLARVAGPSANGMLRQSAASNPSCGQSHLRALAAGPDRVVRRAAASNPVAPEDALNALASDEDLLVRTAEAENLRCPPAALAVLAAEPDDALRLAVARHRDGPIPQLAALAEGREPVVRLAALPTLRQRLAAPRPQTSARPR